MEFTEGEWYINDGSIETEDAFIADVDDHEEGEANAKLIAAAPDLLRACIYALKHHQGGHSHVGSELTKAIEKALK